MREIERELEKEKKRLEDMDAPVDFESRLRGALDASVRKPRRVPPYFKLAAVAVICLALVGYNFNAFAYYGKKLLGFDEVLNATMKDLNEKGMGQAVDKKTTLDDGTELTIDGVMTDANQLIIYYTLSNSEGLGEMAGDVSPRKVTGFLTDSFAESGVAKVNDAGTELKGTMHFEPVNPFARKLTLHYWQGSNQKEESITFPYDPNKAMQTQIKQSINKTVRVDNGKLTFKSITATPTTTIIKGTMDVPAYDRVDLGLNGIELMANGRFIGQAGSGVTTGLSGTTFDVRFDALPEKLETLELVVKEFIGFKKLDEKFVAKEGRYDLDGKELWIKDVSQSERGVEITIATEDHLTLDGVSIATSSKRTPLKTTINQTEEKLDDGRIIKERTMVFETKTTPEYLLIEGIHYRKQYNKKIDIPVK
ncbi:DUF4179 domain-containing protein [Mesobacillus subterraneus]|uniref:DUF4179 domain-containing protein n=1 Tax=Mesobacillus subterraneus TaxID=285983 RepID=A0A3R9E8K9_9BACI|nr:DUF4179 domain-containing protein [Mesobacillus subterraneus]RSD28434.1 DUF4179 domain-containing protein [Mesobacillus subterraneus]